MDFDGNHLEVMSDQSQASSPPYPSGVKNWQLWPVCWVGKMKSSCIGDSTLVQEALTHPNLMQFEAIETEHLQ